MRNKNLYFICCFAIGWVGFLANPTAEAATTQYGRYLTTSDKPMTAQTNLLSQKIEVRFPASVRTVGDAINYILLPSGYSLVPSKQQSPDLKITLSKPLPAIDRNFGPMALGTALTTLAGPAFYLIHDPISRTVNLQVKPAYLQKYAADLAQQQKAISTKKSEDKSW